MSTFIARVAKEGFDADTAPTNQLNFYETKPTFKIVKQMSLPAGHALDVPHGLNYAPNFFAYADDGTNLWPYGSNDIYSSYIDTSNFMVGVDNTEFHFSNNNQPKKIMIFSDIPNNTGYAEQATNENFVFELWDGQTPNRKVMSSMFNHLKEYISDTVTVVSDHYNDGTTESGVTTLYQGEYTHNLGFRPFVVINARAIYPSYINDPSNQSIVTQVYLMPYNDIQYYEPINMALWPGSYISFLSLVYSIDNQKIKMYVKRLSILSPGENIITGEELYELRIYETFKFKFKIFYNDIDEIYSYIA